MRWAAASAAAIVAVSLFLRRDGLAEFPDVAFGVGEIGGAEAPVLILGRLDELDALRRDFLVERIAIGDVGAEHEAVAGAGGEDFGVEHVDPGGDMDEGEILPVHFEGVRY